MTRAIRSAGGAALLALVAFSLTATATTAAPALAWHPCSQESLKGLQCATMTVPKDYANASKGTFDLAVVRAKSTGDRRVGTLFFNPGGPGVASLPIAADVIRVLPEQIRERFDVVLWDPRGVGSSSGLTECAGGTYRLPATGPVDWSAVAEQMRSAQAAANAACAARYPDVVPYISTQATVRDLDALRAAVGDPRLTYWGTSYGTRIGYVYAHNYPSRVRAMLLTSSVDPQGTWTSFAYQSALAPDTALSFMFEARAGLQSSYLRSARTLNTRALRLPSGNEFTRWLFRGTLSLLSTSEASIDALTGYITTVDTALHGTGRAKSAAIAALDKMSPSLTDIPINGGATPFIGCSDYADRPSAEQQASLSARIRGQAPITGWMATQALFYCEGMNVAAQPVPVDFTNWHTPMLLMGSTRDSLTPYGWTADMARTFRNSRVVTYVGSTHTPFLSGSGCIDRFGTDYLVSLTRPHVDVACPNIIPSAS